MKRDMCVRCKNKSIGCKKFCSTYKSSYDNTIQNIIDTRRAALREQEIALRLRGAKRNESK